MILFKDIVSKPDLEIQQALHAIDSVVLVTALKGADNALCDTFFRNMSAKAAGMVKQEMDLLSQPDVDKVKAARDKIAGLFK